MRFMLYYVTCKTPQFTVMPITISLLVSAGNGVYKYSFCFVLFYIYAFCDNRNNVGALLILGVFLFLLLLHSLSFISIII